MCRSISAPGRPSTTQSGFMPVSLPFCRAHSARPSRHADMASVLQGIPETRRRDDAGAGFGESIKFCYLGWRKRFRVSPCSKQGAKRAIRWFSGYFKSRVSSGQLHKWQQNLSISASMRRPGQTIGASDDSRGNSYRRSRRAIPASGTHCSSTVLQTKRCQMAWTASAHPPENYSRSRRWAIVPALRAIYGELGGQPGKHSLTFFSSRRFTRISRF